MVVVEVHNILIHIKELEEREGELRRRVISLRSEAMAFVEIDNEEKVKDMENRIEITEYEIEELGLEKMAMNRFLSHKKEKKEDIYA